MSDVQLLLLDPKTPSGPSAETLFGGTPSVDDGFTWPACGTCTGNMSFLGQIGHPEAERLLLVFMCENDPGTCDEWDANEGGNAVISAKTGNLSLAALPVGGAERPRYGARIERSEAAGYNAARSRWGEENPGRQREVLGQFGGAPEWVQGDETPTCDGCGETMLLVAQLETGPDYATEMNFAGGCGYVFDCGCPAGTPKFLWQS